MHAINLLVQWVTENKFYKNELYNDILATSAQTYINTET